MKKYQGLITRYTRRGYVSMNYSHRAAVFREAGLAIHDVICETASATTHGFWIPRWAAELIVDFQIMGEPDRSLTVKALRRAKSNKTFRDTLQSIKTLGDSASVWSYIENVFGGKTTTSGYVGRNNGKEATA